MVLVGGAGLWGIWSASQGFREYRALARDSNLCGRLQANMLMVRLNVKDYIISAAETDKKQFAAYLDKTLGFLADSQKEIEDPRRAEMVDKIEQLLTAYEDAFAQVVELQEARNRYVRQQLDVDGPKLENGLTQLLESARDTDDTQSGFAAASALRSTLLARLNVAKFLDTNSPLQVERVQQELTSVGEQLAKLDELVSEEQRVQILTPVQELLGNYSTAFDSLVSAIGQRNDLIETQLDSIGPQVASLCEEVKLSAKKDQDILGPRLQSSNQTAVYTIAAFAMGAVVICILAAVLAPRVLLNPILRITESLIHIADGDLTRRIEVATKDELGQLSEHFNSAIDKVQGIIRRTSQSASSLGATATDMQESSRRLSSGADEATEKSASVAAASEQMVTSMDQMAVSAEGMSSNLSTISRSVEEMTESIREISKNTELASQVAMEAKQLADESNETFAELGTSAEEIGSIVQVIEDIAEQTNLLALNATIEAARAGEAGKGFAVVATEVKELARQTSAAIGEIGGSIGRIQASSGKSAASVAKMTDVIERVQHANEQIASAVEQQDSATQSISSSLSDTTHSASSISTCMSDSAQASREVSNNIIGVDNAAKRTANVAITTRECGDRLSDLADEINHLVNEFKV